MTPALRRARFADLTAAELYGLCRLRVDVFVVEQECPYPELDGRDMEPATEHLWFEADGEVAGDDPGAGRRREPGDRPGGDGGRLRAGSGLAARLMDEGIAATATGLPITWAPRRYLRGLVRAVRLPAAAAPATSRTASRTCRCGASP